LAYQHPLRQRSPNTKLAANLPYALACVTEGLASLLHLGRARTPPHLVSAPGAVLAFAAICLSPGQARVDATADHAALELGETRRTNALALQLPFRFEVG